MSISTASTSSNLAYFVGGALSSILFFYFLSPSNKNKAISSNDIKNSGTNDDSDSEDDEQILSANESNNDRSKQWGIMDQPYKVIKISNLCLYAYFSSRCNHDSLISHDFFSFFVI